MTCLDNWLLNVLIVCVPVGFYLLGHASGTWRARRDMWRKYGSAIAEHERFARGLRRGT